MEHWYVYYKLPAADLPRVLPQVRALQSRLGDATGAQPKLQTRLDTPNGVATLMEIYADIDDPAAFGDLLDTALRASALPAVLRAGRRIERFRDL